MYSNASSPLLVLHLKAFHIFDDGVVDQVNIPVVSITMQLSTFHQPTDETLKERIRLCLRLIRLMEQ